MRDRRIKRRVRFSKSPSVEGPDINEVQKTEAVTQNIVLHYLSKLKCFLTASSISSNADHPVPGGRETALHSFKRVNADNRRARAIRNVMEPMEPQPEKYASTDRRFLQKTKPNTNCCSSESEDEEPRTSRKFRKKKALKIVSAAIDYGCATGIIGSRGKYFWLKHTLSKLARRSPTPGPRGKCQKCDVLAKDIQAKRKGRQAVVKENTAKGRGGSRACRNNMKLKRNNSNMKLKAHLFKARHPRSLAKTNWSTRTCKKTTFRRGRCYCQVCTNLRNNKEVEKMYQM